jgi:hypothetical protein
VGGDFFFSFSIKLNNERTRGTQTNTICNTKDHVFPLFPFKAPTFKASCLMSRDDSQFRTPNKPRPSVTRLYSPASTPSISSSVPFDWTACRSLKPSPLSSKGRRGRESTQGSPTRKAVIRKKTIYERSVTALGIISTDTKEELPPSRHASRSNTHNFPIMSHCLHQKELHG